MADRISCPYRGLTPYTEADARFFFGRSEDTQLIVANLFSARMTVLFGPSGVGKSSVLNAGVVRDLRQRQMAAIERGERPDLLIVYFRTWQGHAMAELRQTILREASAMLGQEISPPENDSLTDLLSHVARALEADVMMLLDQFEEYFRYETRFSDPDSFAMQFVEAAGRQGMPVSFLLSLREDSLAELDRFKTLVPNLFTNWYRLDRLNMDAAAMAVRGPVEEYNKLPDDARQFGGTITLDEGLAQEVLQQVRTGAVVIGDAGRGTARRDPTGIETPYLQLVLTQLWEEELTQGSKTLRVETLRRLGGAAAIVRRHVDSVLSRLSAQERPMCARMFDYLVTDSGAKIAYRAGDLAEKADADEASMKILLVKLAEGDKRILTTVAPAPDHPTEPQYEIYHDSLSRAVIAWRRRYIEGRRRRKMAWKLLAIAGVVLLAFLGYGVYQQMGAQRAEAQAAKSEAQAEKSHALELEARAQQSAAEARTLDLRLKELEEARKSDSAEYQKLKEDAKKSIEAAAQYEKASRDLQNQMMKQNTIPAPAANVSDQKLDLETARANRAERDRDYYLGQLEELKKERNDLARQVDVLRRAQTAGSVTLTRVERVLCRLDRIRVAEDGSTGDTQWLFQLTIRPLTGEKVSVNLPLTLNHRSKPLMVMDIAWPVEVDRADPVVLIEITGERKDSKGGFTATGYVDGGRTRSVAFVMPNASDGTVVFDFALARPMSAK